MNAELIQEQVKPEEPEEKAVTIIPAKQAISEMLEEFYQLKQQKNKLLEPLKEELDAITEKAIKLETEIKMLAITELQHGYKTQFGEVVYRRGGRGYDIAALESIQDPEIRGAIDPHKKTTYDSKGLAKIKDPKIKAILEEFKTVEKTQPSATVKIF